MTPFTFVHVVTHVSRCITVQYAHITWLLTMRGDEPDLLAGSRLMMARGLSVAGSWAELCTRRMSAQLRNVSWGPQPRPCGGQMMLGGGGK